MNRSNNSRANNRRVAPVQHYVPISCILPKGTYRTERERQIERGAIVPLSSKPTLWLAEGERERFEAQAKEDFYKPHYPQFSH